MFEKIKHKFSKEELRKKYNFEDRNAFLFCYLIVLLPIIFFCVFFVYVNIDQIFQAFTIETDGVRRFTFEHFAEVFGEFGPNAKRTLSDGSVLNLWQIEWRSFQLYLIGWLTMPLGYMSCYVLFKKCWGHYAFRVIFMIPNVLGGITMVMIYKYMVNVGGPIFELIQSMGVDLSADALSKGLLGARDTAWTTLVLIKVLPHLIGFNIVQTGAYARIPEELFEVGRLEGLGFIREFWSVATPLTWSTMMIGFITGAAGMFTGDCGVFLYTQGQNDTATMGFYIYWQTFLISGAESGVYRPVYGYPAALGLLLTCVTIPIVLLVRKLGDKILETVTY